LEFTSFFSIRDRRFPTFWDRTCLNHIVSLTVGIVRHVPCFSLGFVKDEKIIDFVRAVME